MRAPCLDHSHQLYFLDAENREIGESFVGWQGGWSYMVGTGTSALSSLLFLGTAMMKEREGGKSGCLPSRKLFRRQQSNFLCRGKNEIYKSHPHMWAYGTSFSLSWNIFSHKQHHDFFSKFQMDFLLYRYLFPSWCQFYIKHKRANVGFMQKPAEVVLV